MRFWQLSFASVIGLALGVAALQIGTVAALADPPAHGFAPDPPAIAATKQWIFTIDVKAGKISLGAIREKTLAKPEPTPRILGRYALELWVGKELLDRVRFNAPGGGDGPLPDEKRILKRPAMDRINTRFAVRLADNPRATFAKLVDRATGEETVLRWPPGEDLAPLATNSTTDAGSPQDAGTKPSVADGAVNANDSAKDAGASAPASDAGKPAPK